MQLSTRQLVLPLAVLALGSTARAQATFLQLPFNDTYISAMSPDGTWFTGGSLLGGANFRFSTATGFEAFASGTSGLPDIAVGGSPVAATLLDANGDEYAGLWTPSSQTLLPGLGGQSGNSVSSAYAASDDGSTVVGLAWISGGKAHAFKWSQATGTVDLGSLSGQSSRANGVSADGKVVVGWDEDPTGPRRPAYWDASGAHLLGVIGEAWDATPDGSVIVGDDNGNCFRWTVGGAAQDLGKLRGSDPIFDVASGQAISADGKTIVGYNGNSFFGTPQRAFIWREGAGMTDLRELLIAYGVNGLGSVALSDASAVSADGNTIAGTSGSFFTATGFVATLPAVATVYCTSQVNSAGCTPAIGFDGTPSARTGAGFHVTASNVLSNVNGLLFYGKTGSVSVPFQGGTLCVAAPVTRTPVQNSGGSGACGGTFDLDFNAFAKSAGGLGLDGGVQVWAQYWSRDLASPGRTNLTNALRFTLWP
ncbi:MAG: hypothetical protein IT453_17225 [Planctomycetes bacterium]|nr:hypothetical protein [Planctomycetota bacterium]